MRYDSVQAAIFAAKTLPVGEVTRLTWTDDTTYEHVGNGRVMRHHRHCNSGGGVARITESHRIVSR